MDIINDIILCSIQSFFISTICTIFESSRFSLNLKQIFAIFFVYYIPVQAILTPLVLFCFYNWDIKEYLAENNISSFTLLLAYCLTMVLLIITAFVILRRIRGKEDFVAKSPINIIPSNERGVNMFGNFIAQKRKELGLSLAKLAKLSGHPVSSLHGIENGDNQNPRFEIIIDICQVLGVSLDEMKAAFLEDRNKHD